MYSWQKINLEQDPWWLEYRLNIDNMQGRVWRSSSGLWRDDGGGCYTLTAADRHVVAFSEELTASENIAPTLQRGGEGGRHDGVMLRGIVRRLMPVECERLQGFPDGHTLIPWRGKAAADCPDGLRYKALGNSMAVPVMRWIGMRMLAHVGGGV